MLKRLGILSLILCLLLLQTGCWDRWELEDLAYVVAIGCDSAPDNPDERIVTFKVIIPAAIAEGGGQGGGDGKTSFNLTVRAPSLYSALDLAMATGPRRLSLFQCRALFIGNVCAEKEILSVIRVVARSTELRRDMSLFIVDGVVKDFMDKDQAELEKNPARYYEKNATKNEYTGFTALSTLHEVMNGVTTPGSNAVITLVAVNQATLQQEGQANKAGEIPREGGTPVDYLGVAVFKGAKKVGTLNNEETKALHMLWGDTETIDINLPDPQEPSMTIDLKLIQDRKPEIKVDLDEDPVKVDVRVHFAAHLIGELGGTEYTQPEERLLLQEAVSQYLGDRMRDVIERAQSEFDADIFRIGNHAVKKQFSTWQEWDQYNWPEKFTQADITVSPNVQIQWFGFQAKNPTEEH